MANTPRLDGVQLQLICTDRESLKFETRKKAALLSKGQRPMAGGVCQTNHCVVQGLKGRDVIHESGQIRAGAVHRVVGKTISLSSIGVPASLELRHALRGADKVVRVGSLERALNRSDREAAAEARDLVRKLIKTVVVTPLEDRGKFALTVQGKIAALVNQDGENTTKLGAGVGFEPTTFRL